MAIQTWYSERSVSSRNISNNTAQNTCLLVRKADYQCHNPATASQLRDTTFVMLCDARSSRRILDVLAVAWRVYRKRDFHDSKLDQVAPSDRGEQQTKPRNTTNLIVLNFSFLFLNPPKTAEYTDRSSGPFCVRILSHQSFPTCDAKTCPRYVSTTLFEDLASKV